MLSTDKTIKIYEIAIDKIVVGIIWLPDIQRVVEKCVCFSTKDLFEDNKD